MGLTLGDAGPLPSRLSEGNAAPEGFTLTWLSGSDLYEPADAGVVGTPPTKLPLELPPPPVAAVVPAEPAVRDALIAATPPLAPAAAEVATQHAPNDPAAGDDPDPPVQRQFVQVIVSRWQQPGLCRVGSNAAAARNTMLRHFRRLYWDNSASLLLDPRLSNGIQQRLITDLEAAEASVRTQLQLEPPRPNVFAYADQRLLLAASCANDDVVAYYDGAIHLVPSHADVAQSAVHEYTHHALMSSGLVGPAWAQEGIAMTVANETWWRQREWLERVADKPFSIESMEQAVPYTLNSDQALLFYVQAAAMVNCAIADEPGGLVAFVQSLRQGRGGSLDYTLPRLADPRFFRACANELAR